MFPPYQNASLNGELAIKKQLVLSQKRRYSSVIDTQLAADTGLASQMNAAIQSNLVTLEALLAEASAHYSAFTMNAEIGFDDSSLGSLDYSDSTGSNDNLNDITRAIQQGHVDKSLASSMKSIMIVSNQLKQNIAKLQPVINYLNKGDIANLIHQLEQVDDRYTDIFTTAQDINNLNLDREKEKVLTIFLEQTEKSVQPVFSALTLLLKTYSPAAASLPIPAPGKQPGGGYNLAGIMASNAM
jgi:hypothetical protein